MPPIHAARRERAQEKIAELGPDAALITSLPNVRYLTGLVSSNAALLLPAAGPGVLATDSRYEEAARRDCPDLELVTDRFIEPVLARLAVARGLATVAFEAQDMTVERHAELAALDDGPVLVPLGRLVEELRMVKDATEIALLARACAITDEAFSAAMRDIVPGRTEREFAVRLERTMIDLGAEAPAFDSIVASGPNGAIPHHAPGDRPFAAGDLITIDCGARYGGYIGLEVHEAPTIGYGRTGTLVDRVPVTIEPGIYLPGRGGVRIEDTLVVRDPQGGLGPSGSGVSPEGTASPRASAAAEAAGSRQMLTTTARELLVL
jgi:Xaa-Pro aminopeptidase